MQMQKINAIHLYAVETNVSAVKLYRQIGFTHYSCINEPRPDDLHLICHLKE